MNTSLPPPEPKADFVTFLHCESCSVPYNPNKPNLSLSSCIHISCSNCIKKMPTGVFHCHCGSKAGFMSIHQKMPLQYKLMVSKHVDVITSLSADYKKLGAKLEAFKTASEAQQRHQRHWETVVRNKMTAQQDEIQSLRRELSKRTYPQATQKIASFPPVNDSSKLPGRNPVFFTPAPTMDRNGPMKTANGRGINTAFVPPFPSKKSTPGSNTQKLSMVNLLSAKQPGSSGKQRLSMTYEKSREQFKNVPSSSELRVFQRRT